MIWVLPVLAAMSVSAWIYNSVSEEEQRAQRQWHEKHRSVQKTLSEHRSHIERHKNALSHRLRHRQPTPPAKSTPLFNPARHSPAKQRISTHWQPRASTAMF